MPTTRLTKTSVRALEAGPKQVIHWDEDLPGFGVMVSPGGRKAWVVQYRVGRATRRKALGSAETIALDRARRRAGEVLASVRLGEDPFAPSRTATLNEVADQFLAFVDAKRSPRTGADYREKLDRHIRPVFGTKPLRTISRADIERWHEGLAHIPRTANFAKSVLVAVFTFAIGRGLLGTHEHPALSITKYAENKRTRYLTLTELAAFGKALGALEAERHVSPWAAAALRLLILTGARSGEVLTLTWPMVDLELGQLRLPTSKTGAKTITLSAASVDILRTIPKVEGVPYVIVGRRHGEPMKSLQRPFNAVCMAAGIAGLRPHDLRHSAASIATSGGIGLPAVGKLLGQSQAYTTARYSHIHVEAERAAAEAIAAKAAPLLRRRLRVARGP